MSEDRGAVSRNLKRCDKHLRVYPSPFLLHPSPRSSALVGFPAYCYCRLPTDPTAYRFPHSELLCVTSEPKRC